MLWVWLVVAVLAAIGEAVTLGLFLAPVALAAIVVGILAFIINPALQVGVFAALTLLGIAFVRPAIKHSLGIESLAEIGHTTGHTHLMGRRGIVTQNVDGYGGQIRIGTGEFWSARTFEPTETIPAGEPVQVVLVEGLNALVERVEPAALESTTNAIETSVPNEKGA